MKSKHSYFIERSCVVCFFKKHHGDLVFLAVTIVFFILGFLCRYNQWWANWLEHRNYDFNGYNCFGESANLIEFITILIPAIITIVIIGISIPDAEIFGVHYSDFRKVRGDFEFSLLSMILISFSILLLSIIANLFHFFWTTIYLNLLAVVYCIIFMLKEIPILSKNDNYLFKIIRDSNYILYKDENKRGKTKRYYNQRDKLLGEIKTNLLFEYGIDKTFKILRKDLSGNNSYDGNLIVNIISTQNSYLESLCQNYYAIKAVGDNTYQNVNIIKAIEGSVRNAEQILQNNGEIPLLTLIDKTSNYLILSRMVDILNKTLDKFDLFDCYKTQFNDMLNRLIPYTSSIEESSKNDKFDGADVNIKASISFAMESLDEERLWYFNCLKDLRKKKPDFLTAKKIDDRFLIFLSLCLYYSLSNHHDDMDPIKSSILEFCDDDSWKKEIKNILNNYKKTNFDVKFFLLESLYSCYWGIFNTYMLERYTVGDFTRSDMAFSFDAKYLYYWWINLLSEEELNKENIKRADGLINQYKAENRLFMSNPYIPLEYNLTLFDDYFKFYSIKKSNAARNKLSEMDSNKKDGMPPEKNDTYDFIEDQINLMNNYFSKCSHKYIPLKYEFYMSNRNIGEIKSLFDLTYGINVFTEIFGDWIKSPKINSKIKWSEQSLSKFNKMDNGFDDDDKIYVILPKREYLNENNRNHWKKQFEAQNISVCDMTWPLNAGLVFRKGDISFKADINNFRFENISDKDIQSYIGQNCRLDDGLYRYNTINESKIYSTASALQNEIKKSVVSVRCDIEYHFGLKKSNLVTLVKFDKDDQVEIK